MSCPPKMRPLVALIFVLLFSKVRCRDTPCCTRMAKETINALAVFKECMMEKADRFSSMNDGDCPPSCMVEMFSDQCIKEVNATTADPIEILLSTNFDNELNFTTTTGGECPMPSVIDMISENQHHISKWFQIFCICMRCKYREHTGSVAPSEQQLILHILDCYKQSQDICPQRILPNQAAFPLAILGGQKRNFPCCWKVAVTTTPASILAAITTAATVAPTTTPATTVAPTTTPPTTVAPTTTPATTMAPTTTPPTTEVMTTLQPTTVAPTTVITTPMTCAGHLYHLCNALSDGTRAFLVDYWKCIKERDDEYKLANGVSCSDKYAVLMFSIGCFDNVSTTEKDSITDYAKGEKVFFMRTNATIAAAGCPTEPPAESLINKAQGYGTTLMSWFGHFCNCMNDMLTDLYQNTGNCSTSEMNQEVRDCYATASTLNVYKAFLPGAGAFANLYEDYLSGNGFP